MVCRVVGKHRSAQRNPAKVVSIEDEKQRCRLREIAAEHIRWAGRMAYLLPAVLGRLAVEPHPGQKAMAGGGPTSAYSPQAEAGSPCRWLGPTPSGRVSLPRLGHGLAIRRHR
jgi:hypothetical protein